MWYIIGIIVLLWYRRASATAAMGQGGGLPIVTLPGGGRVADLAGSIQANLVPEGAIPFRAPAIAALSPNVAAGGVKTIVDLLGGAR